MENKYCYSIDGEHFYGDQCGEAAEKELDEMIQETIEAWIKLNGYMNLIW